MTTQTEFPLSDRRRKKISAALDYPLGDFDLKPPDKRPRLQRYLWGNLGLKPRGISVSLKGTLSRFTSPALKRWEKRKTA